MCQWQEFDGRILKLNWAKPKKEKPSSPPQPKPLPIHNLFVANLPFQARAKDLKEFFNANNANVVSAEIIFHENPRRSAGYGFVSFNTKVEAEAAVATFPGKVVNDYTCSDHCLFVVFDCWWESEWHQNV